MALGLLSGCGSAIASDSDPAATELPSDPPCVVAETDEPLGDAPLHVLMQESDVAVEARVAKIEDGITMGSDRTVAHARVTLEVGRNLRGDPVERLDLYLMWSWGDRPICFAGLPRPGVGDSGIWLLTRMDSRFGEGYVPTSSHSILLTRKSR
ncbi:MAG: hypothetical protein H0X12_09875 [Nocardioides sp.]|nr:hypothetical protein [Nocardioides sp.]